MDRSELISRIALFTQYPFDVIKCVAEERMSERESMWTHVRLSNGIPEHTFTEWQNDSSERRLLCIHSIQNIWLYMLDDDAAAAVVATASK